LPNEAVFMLVNPRNEGSLFYRKILTGVLLNGEGLRSSWFCTHSWQYRDAGGAKEFWHFRQQWIPRAKGNLSTCLFGTRAIVSSALL